MKNNLILCFLLSSLFLSAQNNYYVATIGSNSNNGSLNSPWKTIQYGVTHLAPGDILTIKTGTYNEAVSFPISGSSANGYITVTAQTGVIVDGTGKGEVGIKISGKNYIKVIGLEIQNFTGSNVPIGISVDGSSSNIEIRNNKVHHITNANGNAHGIAFYGTSSTPMTNLVIDGNEIRNCKLGQSESMVLNGNVTNFTVSNNSVHDNDNIGIDFIGFEGNGPAGSDQARNGMCTNNTVYNISSVTNPTYGGEKSADGIYVDGGKNIIIEKNKVFNCDIGIELASEHLGKNTADILVRNNFVSGSYQANILAGGYASNKGNSVNITIVNNTTYQGTGGEVALQYNCSNISIKNNILIAKAGQAYLQNQGGNNSGVSVKNNMYFGQSSSSSGSWTDAAPKFMNPQLINAPADMHVAITSPAINAGLNLGNDGNGNPISGAQDIDNQLRVSSGSIDIGADEISSGLPPGCGTPALNATSSVTQTAATLNWTAVSGATSYNVQYKPVSASSWITTSSLTTSKSLTSLTAATVYSFQVQAVCSSTGVYSSASTFTTNSSTSTSSTITLGNGTSAYSAHPFSTVYMDERTQYIISKAELTAAGWSTSSPYLKSIAFNLTNAAAQSMAGFTISISHISATTFSTTSFLSGTNATTVYSGTIATVSGWNTYHFTNSFAYNGTSNLLITICWNNSSFTANSSVQSFSYSNFVALYYRADITNGGVCGQSTGTRSYYRPNSKLEFSNAPQLAPFENGGQRDMESPLTTEIANEITFEIFPNPFDGNWLNGKFSDGNDKPMTVYIYDMLGKEIFSKEIFVEAGNFSFSLASNSLQPGIYFLMGVADGKRYTKMLVVK